MAWNKPSESGEAISRSLHKKSSLKRSGDRFSVKGAVAGAIIALCAAVAAWWLWPNGPDPVAEDGDGTVGRRIKEVSPAKVPSQAVDEKVVAIPKQESDAIVKEQPADKNHGKKRDKYYSSSARRSLATKTFANPANQAIASLLTMRPGESLLGESSMYYKDIKKFFLESIENDEIKFNDDDSPEVRELKTAVIETRNELRERMDAGEDIVTILQDAREQMRELGLYHAELRKEVERIASDPYKQLSEQDMHELIEAANKMLEERGSEPLGMTGPMAYKFRLDQLERRQEELEKQLKEENK